MHLKIDKIWKVDLNTEGTHYNFYSDEDTIVLSIDKSILMKLFSTYLSKDLKKTDVGQENKITTEGIASSQNTGENINNLDFDSEFTDVPAYIRRGITIKPEKPNRRPEEYSNIIISEIISHREQVFIYLLGKNIPLFEAEKLTNACCEFMEALGYELEQKDEPVYKSFLQKIWFVLKKGAKSSRKEIVDDFSKGKKALELKYVELPTADQTEKLANSALKIVELLKDQEEGIVRLGALLVLKKMINGESKIIIQQLNFELITILDKNPQLLQNLQSVYNLITNNLKEKERLNEFDSE
jgi:hypothetical protein